MGEKNGLKSCPQRPLQWHLRGPEPVQTVCQRKTDLLTAADSDCLPPSGAAISVHGSQYKVGLLSQSAVLTWQGLQVGRNANAVYRWVPLELCFWSTRKKLSMQRARPAQRCACI